MGKKLVDRRSKVKPFIKVVNYNHLMPTRYTLELEGLKGAVTADTFKEVSQREDAKKNVKKALEDRYTSGKNRWFFTPLRTLFAAATNWPFFSHGQFTDWVYRFLNGLHRRFVVYECADRGGRGEEKSIDHPVPAMGWNIYQSWKQKRECIDVQFLKQWGCH